MTGLGRGECEGGGLVVLAEVKSVNHRFRDFRFRMPSFLSQKEIVFKGIFEECFRRGSFDIFIHLGDKAEEKRLRPSIDFSEVHSFLEEFKKNVPGDYLINPIDFLKSEFFRANANEEEAERGPNPNKEDLSFQLAEKALRKAAGELLISRESEGKKSLGVIVGHLDAFRSSLDRVEGRAKGLNETISCRLRERFGQYKEEFKAPESRFMQEVIFYLERLDISEEINRMKAHLQKLGRILKEKNEVGREMEFLLQELNRETNTLGSKSSLVEISEEVVKMKVELEKMREQGPNIQ